MSENALHAAQAALAELIEAAKSGQIIPVRLPGQLEEIQSLLEQADEAQSSGDGDSAPSPDLEAYIAEQGEFLSVAVHELRTPMTSIRGYADMMRSMGGDMNDMAKQSLEVIRTNARRMEGLLSDVSAINKLRSGRLRVAPKMDMPKNLLQMVEKNTRPLAEELDRTLTFDVPQGLPILNLDTDHVVLALTKLVENALRYSPDEGEVVVSAVADGSNTVIQIKDNGIGMSDEELAQLGTLYWRAEHDEVRAHKGSGLGIPIAFGMIDVVGGTVNVESERGVGTLVTVTLPGMS